MSTRKNQRALASAERSRFVAALKRMKTDRTYDQYVQWHVDAMGMGPQSVNYAHQGPAFLPWHREFILLFEQDMQKADRALGGDGSLTLPYWDWTAEQGADPAANPLWGDNFLSPSGDADQGFRVMSGPFATDTTPGAENWVLRVVDPMDNAPVNYLQRAFGRDLPDLPNQVDVNNVLAIAVYDSAPWDNTVRGSTSFRNLLEGWVTVNPPGRAPGLHNRVHVWIGGAMAVMSSPNDPVFFLHHCNVDRIWASWQARYPSVDQYPPTTEAPPGQNRGDLMPPFDGRADARPGGVTMPSIRPADVLDSAALGYSYDTLI